MQDNLRDLHRKSQHKKANQNPGRYDRPIISQDQKRTQLRKLG